MASESDTEEFYDAPEELSPLRNRQRKDSQKQEAENKTEKEDKEKDLCLPQDGADKNNVPNSAKQTSSVQGGAVSSEPTKKQPSDVGNKATPPPVAPPRKKRQQKKEALAKSQDPTGLSKPQVKPPRPARPPCKDLSSLVEQPEVGKAKQTQENQPFITVNANATDMDEVLMKGSSLNVVQNRDLDEFKSPTGSKVQLEKDHESGTSTPKGVTSKDEDSQGEVVTKRNLMRDMSQSERPLSDIEILEQVIVKNLDTGETVPLSLAEDKLPKCTNPLALQIMRLTSEYSSDSNITSLSEDGYLSDSSVAPSIKLESKRKKLKKFLGKTVQKIKSVADEVKARREETSSSDEDEMQNSYYIKMKTHKAIRDKRAFEKIQLLQDLNGEHIGAIWIMKFSLCGRLIAAAGQDNIVRVWVLKEAQSFFEEMRAKYARVERGSPTSSITSINSITSAEDDTTLEDDGSSKDDREDGGPFAKSPFCTYHGHTSDVLDLSWSKNYFILSSSMDKTVRLWHISRHECLCCFQHVDFVTAICFHPKDDRYFLSGSLDGKIRLWNIPEKRVALWNEIDGSGTSLITAANFCQDGKLAVVGTYDGRCIFYDTERLKYHTQITVRSTRGKNARGRKISGIEPMPGEDKVLITSNDSRVRLYDLKDHSLYCKYKGASNSSSQIKASFSHDGQYIVSGSEDHFVYIWRSYHDIQNVRKDRSEYYESFSAHDAVVTAAVFAPIPSLFSPLTESDAKEQEIAGATATTTGDAEHHCEVLATADWSGAIKLFVNR